MATIETTAMTSARTGNRGYKGTLNGRSNRGSLFRSRIKATMDTMYKVSAPNTEMMIMFPVCSVSSAIMPIHIFTNNAFDGVRKRGWIFPKNDGANLTRPNSKLDLPAARMIP